MRAYARTTDPETSHAAAHSVADLRMSQSYVHRVLKAIGPLTDEELVDHYQWNPVFERFRPQSASGIRSRRAELVRLGLVEYTGEKRLMRTGRMARVWRVTPKN